MSTWEDQVEAHLKCPTCAYENEPGRLMITLDRHGRALCSLCGCMDDAKAFIVATDEPDDG